MTVRSFKITNKNGQSYNLLTRGLILHGVGGLGYMEDTMYQQFVNRYKVIDAKFEQWTPSGSIFFAEPGAYSKYYDFVRFCQNTPMILSYTPPGMATYTMEVRLAEIDKSEKFSQNGLDCRVTFRALTPFYRTVVVYNSGEITDGKTYDYTYNYKYSDSIRQTVTINSDSYSESPARLVVYGPATNPSWRHYVNNVLYETGSVRGVIAPNRKLVVDTTQIPYSITQQDLAGNVVQDMYALSDFATERFLLLQNGVNTIVVGHEGTSLLRMEVEAMIEYASV